MRILWLFTRVGLSLALIIVAALLAVGQWYNPSIVRPEALSPVLPPTTIPPAVVVIGTSPAAALITDALTTSPGLTSTSPPTLATLTDPLLVQCNIHTLPVPAVAASSTVYYARDSYMLGAVAYAAGLGPWALNLDKAALSSCGLARVTDVQPGGGFLATGYYQNTYYTEVLFHVGDVVVTALSPSQSATTTSNLTAMSSDIASFLTNAASSCATLQSPPDDYLRNPLAPGYRGLLVRRTITLPPSVPRPVLDPTTTTAPTSVQTSVLHPTTTTTVPLPPGSVRVPPVAPVAPTFPALTATIEVTTRDATGPGCGWAFTTQRVPTPPSTNVHALAQSARSALLASWQAWPSVVQEYQTALALYSAQRSAYDLWVATSTTTTTTTLPVATTTSSTATSTTTTPTTTTTTTLAPTTTTAAPSPSG
jgi:hypothetical protein